MAKKGSSGRHRGKSGKIRQFGANASGRRAAERAKQAKIAEQRGKGKGNGKGKGPAGADDCWDASKD